MANLYQLMLNYVALMDDIPECLGEDVLNDLLEDYTADLAARDGLFGLVKLYHKREDLGSHTGVFAMISGHFHIVEWLVDNKAKTSIIPIACFPAGMKEALNAAPSRMGLGLIGDGSFENSYTVHT